MPEYQVVIQMPSAFSVWVSGCDEADVFRQVEEHEVYKRAEVILVREAR